MDILHFDGHSRGFLRDESNSRRAVWVSVEKNFVLRAAVVAGGKKKNKARIAAPINLNLAKYQRVTDRVSRGCGVQSETQRDNQLSELIPERLFKELFNPPGGGS